MIATFCLKEGEFLLLECMKIQLKAKEKWANLEQGKGVFLVKANRALLTYLGEQYCCSNLNSVQLMYQ